VVAHTCGRPYVRESQSEVWGWLPETLPEKQLKQKMTWECGSSDVVPASQGKAMSSSHSTAKSNNKNKTKNMRLLTTQIPQSLSRGVCFFLNTTSFSTWFPLAASTYLSSFES
jgi:hypothetical protein